MVQLYCIGTDVQFILAMGIRIVQDCSGLFRIVQDCSGFFRIVQDFTVCTGTVPYLLFIQLDV